MDNNAVDEIYNRAATQLGYYNDRCLPVPETGHMDQCVPDAETGQQRGITSQQIFHSGSPAQTAQNASQPQHQLPPWTTYGSIPATVSYIPPKTSQSCDTTAIKNGLWDEHQLVYPMTASNLWPVEYPENTNTQSYSYTSRATTQEYQYPENFWRHPFSQNAPGVPVDQVNLVSGSLLDMDPTNRDEISLYRVFPTTVDPLQSTVFEPPDLFESLKGPQSSPPTEERDANARLPAKEGQTAQEDLYTPKWVRGTGKDRKAWCGFCKPGKWLTRKDSAYRYHLLRCHGVRPSGQRMEAPIDFRLSARKRTQVWQGLCECGKWIVLSSECGTEPWFNHVSQCSKMRERVNRA